MACNLKVIGRKLLLIPFIGFPILVQAQQYDEDMLFDEIPSVFTASKYEQKISDAPARISVITAKDIQRYGYRNLTEALQSLPGIQLSYDHSYSYLGVRGLNVPGDFNSRILVLVDGHRINENIYDGVVVDKGNMIDIDLIKQIEMIRGPASSLYGSSAFLGVINIITKDGRDLDGIQLAADTGSHNTHQGRISYGKLHDNGLEILVSASRHGSKGADRYFAEFDDPATNDGVAEGADEGHTDSLWAKLNYADFKLSLAYVEHEKEIPTASYNTVFNDDLTQTLERRSYLNLEYNTLLEGGTDISAKLFYDQYWYEGEYTNTGEYDPNYLYLDNAKGQWWGIEAQLSKVFFASHRLTTGLEYRDNLETNQEASDVYETYLDIDTSQQVYGLYVQDEWQANEQWAFSFGLRYDAYSDSESSINPRLAAIWNDNQTTLKLLYGTAFRAPNAYELFYKDGYTHKVAEILKPETVESYELIWEQQLSSTLRFIGSLYKNNIENMLVLITDPTDEFAVFANRDDVASMGLELEFLMKFSNGWSGSANYSYQKPEDGNGEQLVNTPLNMAKLNVLSPLIAQSLLLGLELQYEDSRKTLAGSDTDPRVLGNLNVSNNTLIDKLTLTAGIYNLFDETYSHPGFLEHVQNKLAQNGRTYQIKAIYQF
jgi:iron complex outermembrane receptor protein